MKCAFCGKNLQEVKKISRQDRCPNCNRDLRCCKQCRFYDLSAFNDCKEVEAERIIDKKRANFCDYFVLNDPKNKGGTINRQIDAMVALEALFKKK